MKRNEDIKKESKDNKRKAGALCGWKRKVGLVQLPHPTLFILHLPLSFVDKNIAYFFFLLSILFIGKSCFVL